MIADKNHTTDYTAIFDNKQGSGKNLRGRGFSFCKVGVHRATAKLPQTDVSPARRENCRIRDCTATLTEFSAKAQTVAAGRPSPEFLQNF